MVPATPRNSLAAATAAAVAAALEKMAAACAAELAGDPATAELDPNERTVLALEGAVCIDGAPAAVDANCKALTASSSEKSSGS